MRDPQRDAFVAQNTMYTVLKQIQHSVHSDKNESESFDRGRGLRIGTETWDFSGKFKMNLENVLNSLCLN